MWPPPLAPVLIAVMPSQSGLPGLGSALPAHATGCTERAHGPQTSMGCPVSALHPGTSIYLLLPTSVVSAVNDLTKRGLNGMTNKRYVTAHASAHSKMICNYLISVMQITPSSP